MKIILTGTTGFIGKEILSQCLSHPAITSIVILTRRDLPTTDPKVQIYRMQDDDFLSYSSPQLTAALRGAHACIWSLGVVPSRASDAQAIRRVTVDFTEQAAQAFTRTCSGSGSRFRFVYLSGSLAERDQSKSLWFSGPYRRVRVCFSPFFILDRLSVYRRQLITIF
ncbi:hypothetical protein P168DRAFT_291643 [Aspergillus campestris IBT 28561]|uniref:NAD(P)-binding domain-containing protein n=1 Tax=Aspergillus campestris (strain IBT 28561) TaxID=1392248 RepID=A0A2I1CY01_ASPC2|nr:uncharacterized protein P168DRAFT_291643 [Aspergillus campestris IBT 28561]PKY02497.1 hypothetical protein P168DRAFT_291643 [Aspergillus campestris IBT 28561]